MLVIYNVYFEISFEMVDCNLRFVVTIPIHMGAMKVRRKVRRGNSFSSERSSETTAISSGTHPHKVLEQAKRQSRVQEQPYNRNQARFFLFLHKVAKASMRFLPFLSHRTTVSVDKC